MWERGYSPSRRGVLGGAAGLGALSIVGCTTEQPVAVKPAARVGIQLYTLRAQIAQDLPGVLTELAGLGYKEVEGYGGLNPPTDELKRMLADNGLKMPSAHIDTASIRDNPGPEIERAVAMGYEYAVLPWVAPEQRDTLDKYRAWADTANSFAEACHAAGVKFCWHNHDFEFHPIDGVTPFDVLWERCDPELVKFEVDLYWAYHAGVDLEAFMATHAARVPMVHVKDSAASGEMTDVGDGVIDFAGLFARYQFEHYYVERDDGDDPMRTAANSYRALASILSALPA